MEAKLAEVRDGSSFAEMLVAVLEQVATLRYIGSQTHPAIQQMVLQHEGRLEQVRWWCSKLLTIYHTVCYPAWCNRLFAGV